MKDKRLQEAVRRVIKAARQRSLGKAALMKIVDVAKQSAAPAASLRKKYLEEIGISLPTKAEARACRVAFDRLMRKVRLAFRSPRLPRELPDWSEAAFDREGPVGFPFCFSSAIDCQVAGSNSCSVSQATLKLRDRSNGLGGEAGIGAIPNIPSVTGSMFYALEVPSEGLLTSIAQVSFTGIVSCRSDAYFTWGEELPTVYGKARLTLRLLIHQSGTVKEEMLIQEVHSKPFPGEISTFNDDVYVLIAMTSVAAGPVVAEVQADLWALGRSDYGFAELDFATGHFGIRVPAMCFNFTPHPPPA